MNEVKPLEENDILISELFMDIANKRYDRFNTKQIIENDNNIIFIPYKNNHVGGRNQICEKTKLKIKKCNCMDLFK